MSRVGTWAERRDIGPSRLGQATTVEVGTDGRVLLVPLGSTEQHGPHLPLDTDTRVAAAWAAGIAQRWPPAVVAAALPYGSSGEHQSFAGTLSIGGEALHAVVVELARSANESGFAGVVFVCGHAGNLGPLGAAVAQLRAEGHQILAFYPRWGHDPATFGPLDAHAGRTETSLMLHIAPELVDLDAAEPGATEPASQLMDRMTSGGVAAVSANGVLGDPTGANPAEGARLLADLVERSVAELGSWS